jgi:hypothetical protein
MSHFGKKTVIEHLKEARARGALASAEVHGTEQPGHLAAGCDAARETAFLLGVLFLLFHPSLWHFFITTLAILIWKVGRSALLGWARLERLHRLIEEERWEIEHSRKEEEEELAALYEAKGFSGQLLKDVISTLSADDNRLLKVMLEEEMGLTLEVYEHPIKQCLGAFVGVIVSTSLVLLGFMQGQMGGIGAVALVVTIAAYLIARAQRNEVMTTIVWNLALVAFGLGVVYLLRLL